MIIFCEYGCGEEAKYRFKNRKWCCSENHSSCKAIKYKMSEKHQGKAPWNKGLTKETSLGMKKNSESNKKTWKNPNSKFKSEDFFIKRSKANRGRNNPMFGKRHPNRLTIEKINERYVFFSKIEEMRYNPDKPEEKEIQVHCKNHLCENSKEKNGWFIPTKIQLSERIRCLERHGTDNSYFYCSQECKDICPLYHSKGIDNYLKTYTDSEYQTFRNYVLNRDNYKCGFCGEKATEVHHERPQKLEPFFALDPYFAWSCCEKCHYEKGHKGECSTGKLANVRCK